MDAWKRWELEMEKKRIENHYDTQQKMLEVQKSMWDKHNNKNQMEEKQTKLNIQNIQKLENQRLVDTSYYPIIDTIEEKDYEYVFNILLNDGLGITQLKKIKIKLQRNKQFTNEYGENYYRAYYGDTGQLDSISSKCISNPQSFKAKLMEMIGLDAVDFSNITKPINAWGGPTHSIAYFTDTNSVSGGDSEKLQTLSDFFNNI
jgi:hypothetical protein